MDTKKLLFLTALAAILNIISVQAQECTVYPIPSEHLDYQTITTIKNEWNSTGTNAFPLEITTDRQYDVTEYGIKPDMQPCGQKIVDLIKKLEISADNPAMLYFPPGAYLIDKPLTLSGYVILKGAGGDAELPEQTHFHFDLSDDYANPCINISGSYNGVEDIYIIDDTKCSIEIIKVPKAISAAIPVLKYEVKNATTMITNIIGVCSGYGVIEGNTGTFKCSEIEPGEYNVTTTFSNVVESKTINHKLKVYSKKDNIYSGIQQNNQLNDPFLEENSKIYRSSQGYSNPDDFFKNTINISGSNNWIRGVESYNTRRFHVEITGNNNTVSGCYFHHSVDYSDNSGRGYGVDVKGYAKYNRIENNIFYYLRHAMVLEGDALKNVFGYNYSTDIHATGGGSLYPSDLLLYGRPNNAYETGPKLNLLEGNYVERARVDWVDKTNKKPNGPFNTFFRCFSLHDFKIEYVYKEYQDGQYAQNVIGSRMWPTSGTIKRIKKKGFYDYWFDDPYYWEIPDEYCSFYYFSKPNFYYETLPWPLRPWEFQPPSAVRYFYATHFTVFQGWDDYIYLCAPPNQKFYSKNWISENTEYKAMKKIVIDNSQFTSDNEISFYAGKKIILKPGTLINGLNSDVIFKTVNPCNISSSYKVSENAVVNNYQNNIYIDKSIIDPDLNESSVPTDISIYPNPNKGSFEIKSGNIIDNITLYAMDGNKLNAKIIKKENICEVEIMNKYQGIIVVSIESAGKFSFQKVIIK